MPHSLIYKPSGFVRPQDALLSPEELDWRCDEDRAGRNPSEVECFLLCEMKLPFPPRLKLTTFKGIPVPSSRSSSPICGKPTGSSHSRKLDGASIGVCHPRGGLHQPLIAQPTPPFFFFF